MRAQSWLSRRILFRDNFRDCFRLKFPVNAFAHANLSYLITQIFIYLLSPLFSRLGLDALLSRNFLEEVLLSRGVAHMNPNTKFFYGGFWCCSNIFKYQIKSDK